MFIIRCALAAVLISLPLAASADEAPHAKVHKAHYGRVAHGPRVHFGYYWHEPGWRWGGTRYTWYGSYFRAVPPWW